MPVAWCTQNTNAHQKDICTTSFPVGCFIDKNGQTLSRCDPVSFTMLTAIINIKSKYSFTMLTAIINIKYKYSKTPIYRAS